MANNYKIKIDTTEVDTALEKVELLKQKLEKIQTFAVPFTDAYIRRQEELRKSGGTQEWKTATCMTCHMQAFLKQSQKGEQADIAVACEICPYNKNCSFDWLHIIQPLVEQSGLKLTVLTSERPV